MLQAAGEVTTSAANSTSTVPMRNTEERMVSMIKKLHVPIRVQFLIIALSLAVTTTVLGLSAYLTDTDTYQGTFKTVGGDDLGFRLTGEEHDEEEIVPGSTVPLDLKALVNQSNDLCIFVDLDIPADFAMAGLNSAEWHQIKEGSTIYYHGTASSCVSLGPTNGSESDVLSGVTLSTDVQGGANYSVTITGYAIQATNIDEAESTPEQIFGMIGGTQNEAP